MPEVLGNPPSPRTALFWNGTAWQWALVDAAGNLQIDVVASGLPVGAATAAAQALALAQLQTIAEIRDALQSVATDRLIVRGEDQLFSYADTLLCDIIDDISGVDGHLETPVVPANQVWVVTNIRAVDATTATTLHDYRVNRVASVYPFAEERAAFAADIPSFYHHWVWLNVGDRIRVLFTGGLAGDTCRISLVGHIMTLET